MKKIFALCFVVMFFIHIPMNSNAASATYYSIYSSSKVYQIPDNGTAESMIDVYDNFTISNLDISVGINHSRRGDLNITVIHPSGAVKQIFFSSNDDNPNVYQSFLSISSFNTLKSEGAWKLIVNDTLENLKNGTIEYWRIKIYYTMIVDITSPIDGSTVSGNIDIQATGNEVEKMDLYIDGSLLGTMVYSAGIFEYTLDTSLWSDGKHIIRVEGKDFKGNSLSDTHIVYFDNWDIYVSIFSPLDNEIERGLIYVSAFVPDYAVKGKLYVDGIFSSEISSPTFGTYSFSLNTISYKDGYHALNVIAYDPDGNSASESVTVLFDNTAPIISNVSVIYPGKQEGAKLSDTIYIIATSKDETSGMKKLECNISDFGGGLITLYDDGAHNDGSFNDGIYGSDGIVIGLSTTMGTHFLNISAEDNAGNVRYGSARVYVDTKIPMILYTYIIYPQGQSAAKYGDKIRVGAKAIDTKMTLDTVLVLDTSGSMAGQPLKDMKAAAKSFIGNLGQYDMAAVYSFDNPRGAGGVDPQLEIGFTTNKNAVNATIDALSADDWTPLYDTVYEAIEYAKTSKNLPIVIVLTDGEDWGPGGKGKGSTHTLADVSNAPLPVFTIGLEPSQIGSSLDENVLKQIAYTSDGGAYYYAPSSAQLADIYKNISEVMSKMNVGGIRGVYSEISVLGEPTKEMFDDGKHADKFEKDDIYVSDEEVLTSRATQISYGDVFAYDIAYNEDKEKVTIKIDNTPPTISNISIQYVSKKWWAEDGDGIFITAKVKDYGIVAGISRVFVNATDIGGNPIVQMNDQGTGNDAKAYDDIYSSDTIIVNSGGKVGYYNTAVIAYDNASNLATGYGSAYIDNLRPIIIEIKKPTALDFICGTYTFLVYTNNRLGLKNISIIASEKIYATVYNEKNGYYECPIDTKQFLDGKYNFTTIGYDLSGRKIDGNALEFYIDNNPPNIILNYPKDKEVVSGIVDINVTANDIFLSKIEYRIDSTTWYDISVRWFTFDWSEGEHILEVRAIDMAWHISNVKISVIVDNTMPTIIILEPGNNEYVSGEIEILATAWDNSDIELVGFITVLSDDEIQENWSSEWKIMKYDSGHYKGNLDTTALLNKRYILEVIAFDKNWVKNIAFTVFYVDNTKPKITINSPISGSFLPSDVFLNVTVTDSPYHEYTILFNLDDGDWKNMEFSIDETWIASLELSAGMHKITFKAEDLAKNVEVKKIEIYVDDLRPTIEVFDPLKEQIIFGNYTIRVVAKDDYGIQIVMLSIEGTKYRMRYNEGYYEYILATSSLSDGRQNITITAFDLSGKNSNLNYTLLIDNNIPTLTIEKPKNYDYISGIVYLNITYNDSFPCQAWYSIDGGDWKGINVGIDTAKYGDGAHKINVKVKDLRGNEAYSSIVVFMDTKKPKVSIVKPLNNMHISSSYTISVLVSEECEEVKAVFSGVEISLYKNLAGYYEGILDTTRFSDGEYKLMVYALDKSGLSGGAEVKILVDNSAPKVKVISPKKNIYNKDRIEFVFDVYDESKVSLVYLRVKGGGWIEMLNDGGKYKFTLPIEKGRTEKMDYVVKVRDSLGNEEMHGYDVTVSGVPEFFESLLLYLLLILIPVGTCAFLFFWKKKEKKGIVEIK
ncbi:MAG: Ig-like domain-containing protein [Candidatus Thermoplasmatota archaeon]